MFHKCQKFENHWYKDEYFIGHNKHHLITNPSFLNGLWISRMFMFFYVFWFISLPPTLLYFIQSGIYACVCVCAHVLAPHSSIHYRSIINFTIGKKKFAFLFSWWLVLNKLSWLFPALFKDCLLVTSTCPLKNIWDEIYLIVKSFLMGPFRTWPQKTPGKIKLLSILLDTFCTSVL